MHQHRTTPTKTPTHPTITSTAHYSARCQPPNAHHHYRQQSCHQAPEPTARRNSTVITTRLRRPAAAVKVLSDASEYAVLTFSHLCLYACQYTYELYQQGLRSKGSNYPEHLLYYPFKGGTLGAYFTTHWSTDCGAYFSTIWSTDYSPHFPPSWTTYETTFGTTRATCTGYC